MLADEAHPRQVHALQVLHLHRRRPHLRRHPPALAPQAWLAYTSSTLRFDPTAERNEAEAEVAVAAVVLTALAAEAALAVADEEQQTKGHHFRYATRRHDHLSAPQSASLRPAAGQS